MKNCPLCGLQNRDDAKFCRSCGRKLDAGMKKKMSGRKLSNSLERGKLLGGRFKIENMVKPGGMGYIYRGRDVNFKRTVAIKEMMDHFTKPDERKTAIDRFRREAQILCKLEHPAIPKFYDYFVEDNRYYLVMDFIHGKDLRELHEEAINSGEKLEINQLINWAVEICGVLEYLHSRIPPIIYRDIKPSNIIITGDGRVHLVDFGIARLFAPKIKATMVGTQGYAPPEQYRGKAEPRSDIYGMGATLHHLLTGNDPQFEAPFHFESVRKFNSKVPEPLAKIVDKCLSLIPDDRYQSAQELKNALLSIPSYVGSFTDLSSEIRQLRSEIGELKRKKTGILDGEGRLQRRRENRENLKKNISASLSGGTSWNQFKGNPRRTALSSSPLQTKGMMNWRYKVIGGITSSPVIDEGGNVYLGTDKGKFYSFDTKGHMRWEISLDSPPAAAASVNDDGSIFIVTEDGKLTFFDAEGIEVWNFNLRMGVKAAPLVCGNRIYVACSNGVFCSIDPEGKIDWQFKAEDAILSSPALGPNNSIIVTSKNGVITSLDESGKTNWWTKLPGAISATPLITEEGIIFSAIEDKNLYALNPQGKVAWSFKTDGKIFSSPSLAGDGTVFIGSMDSHLYAVNRDGSMKWRFNAEDPILSTPAINDVGNIYVIGSGGFLYCLSPRGQVKWWFNLMSEVSASPAIGPKGEVYAATLEGFIYSII